VAELTFWAQVERLVAEHPTIIDRPQGTHHPRYPDVVYPFDYGYLQGTSASDGGGIDVCGGSGERSTVTGIVCTLDWVKRDMEVKLLLGCTEAEMQAIAQFFQNNYMACTLIKRDATQET
jgi:inorganic pyrophosphatase